jgi:hypothetical protein
MENAVRESVGGFLVDKSWVLERTRLVPRRGVEPRRAYAHHPLKMACLPDSTTSAYLSFCVYGRMAGVAGLEPTTGGFGDRCSTN